MLAASIVLATTLLANRLVDVRSSSACPSSQDIADRLSPLLPHGPISRAEPDIATITVTKGREDGAQLQVRLVRAGGTEVGDRRLDLQLGQCAEAAATVAAVIAAWEIEPPLPARAGAPAPAAAEPNRAAASAAARTLRISLGAGGGAGIVGGVAGLGKLEALVGKARGRLRGRIGFAGETLRTSSLAPGNVDWRHTVFEVGVLWRTLDPRWSLSLDAALTLGWATLVGQGFSMNNQRSTFEPGAAAAMRLGRSLGGWSVWAEVRAYGWAMTQHASLAGESSGADLPRADVTASLGISTPFF